MTLESPTGIDCQASGGVGSAKVLQIQDLRRAETLAGKP